MWMDMIKNSLKKIQWEGELVCVQLAGVGRGGVGGGIKWESFLNFEKRCVFKFKFYWWLKDAEEESALNNWGRSAL